MLEALGGLLGLLAEEREVVHDAFRNKLGHRRVIQDREERLAVGAREHELVLVTHEEQVVAHEIGIDVSDDRSRLAQAALERGKKQGERGRSLPWPARRRPASPQAR
mgnify:CR=1 FL=1